MTRNTVCRWEHFPHEADMGVRGVAPTKAEAFAQAALALTAVITQLDVIKPTEQVTLTAEAPDDELLLVDFLNALIFEMATRKMLFSCFEVNIADGRLTARAWGEHTDVARHQPAVEVKGATYTQLHVGERDGLWTAQCVVDV